MIPRSTVRTPPSSILLEDCMVPHAGNNSITSLAFGPKQEIQYSNLLASTNYDKFIRIWGVAKDENQKATATSLLQTRHEGPVLDACFTSGAVLVSAGADKKVRMTQPATTPNSVAPCIGIHDAPVRCVRYLPNSSCAVSGSWDKTVKLWDSRSSTPVASFNMPERVYGLDVSLNGNLMVVATASRHVVVYDCSSSHPVEISRNEQKNPYQIKAVTCFPDGSGYATGHIDGKVRFEDHLLPLGQNKKPAGFQFRAHHKNNKAFAVNAISFCNKRAGVLVTMGGDGIVKFWNKGDKKLIKACDAIDNTITCGTFNGQGDLFAYATSYDWSKGAAHAKPEHDIFIHKVATNDVTGRYEKGPK